MKQVLFAAAIFLPASAMPLPVLPLKRRRILLP